MKKPLIVLFFAFIVNSFCYSQNIDVTVTVTNITVNGGKVYLTLFSSANSFRSEEPDYAYELQDNNTQVSHTVSVPSGEYVVFAFQDANGNQKLDSNVLGIPRELIGISNYSGRGLPSRNFDRQKIRINNSTGLLTLRLYRF